MNPSQYQVVINWSEEDEGYVAICPDLFDISAFGMTRAEAAEQVEMVIDLAVETLEADAS